MEPGVSYLLIAAGVCVAMAGICVALMVSTLVWFALVGGKRADQQDKSTEG